MLTHLNNVIVRYTGNIIGVLMGTFIVGAKFDKITFAIVLAIFFITVTYAYTQGYTFFFDSNYSLNLMRRNTQITRVGSLSRKFARECIVLSQDFSKIESLRQKVGL